MRLRIAADLFGSPGRRLEIARGAHAFGGTVNTRSGVVSALSAAGALRVFAELLAMGGWQGRVPSRVGPEGQRGACRCARVAGGEHAGRLPRASAHVIQRTVAHHSHGQLVPTFGVQIRVSVQRHAARVLRARRICAVGTRKMFCARWRMHVLEQKKAGFHTAGISPVPCVLVGGRCPPPTTRKKVTSRTESVLVVTLLPSCCGPPEPASCLA